MTPTAALPSPDARAAFAALLGDRRALEQTDDLIGSAVDSVTDGITIARLRPSGDAPLVYVNSAFCRMTGYAAEEVIGRDCKFLQKGGGGSPGAARAIRKALAQRRRITITLQNRRKSGEVFWNELTIAPVGPQGRDATHFVGIQRDVTRQEQQLATLNEFNVLLQQQADALRLSNASLDAFAAAISHDLRAPLALIRTFADLAAGAEDGAERVRSLDFVRSAAVRMDEMIGALLQLARVSSGGLECRCVDLSAMAHEAAKALSLQWPGRLVELRIEPALRARADPVLLRTVVENLLSNAWKYTARTAAAQVRVGRSAGAHEDEDVFFVQDNGVGFAADAGHCAFTLFRRHHAEADFPGHGVGLASAKHIVARHGGRLWAESAPGRGATFYFSLPRLQRGGPAPTGMPGAGPAVFTHPQ